MHEFLRWSNIMQNLAGVKIDFRIIGSVERLKPTVDSHVFTPVLQACLHVYRHVVFTQPPCPPACPCAEDEISPALPRQGTACTYTGQRAGWKLYKCTPVLYKL